MRVGDLKMDFNDIMHAFGRISQGQSPYPADTWAILASLVELAKKYRAERDMAKNLLHAHDKLLQQAEAALGDDKYGEALSKLHRAVKLRDEAQERIAKAGSPDPLEKS